MHLALTMVLLMAGATLTTLFIPRDAWWLYGSSYSPWWSSLSFRLPGYSSGSLIPQRKLSVMKHAVEHRYILQGEPRLFSIARRLCALSLLLTTNSWTEKLLIGFVCANTWIILFSWCDTMLQKGKKMSKLEKQKKCLMKKDDPLVHCFLIFFQN